MHWELTLELLSSLELSEGLARAFPRLHAMAGVDRVFVEAFDPALNAMRTLARVDASGPAARDELTGLSSSAVVPAGMPALEAPLVPFDASSDLAEQMYAYHRIPASAGGLLLVLGPLDAPLACAVFIRDDGAFASAEAEQLSPLRDPLTVAVSNALAHRELARLQATLEDDKRFFAREPLAGSDIIGAEGGLRDVMSALERVARTDSTVLLLGETGTGKDLLASALHRASPRADGPFVSLNCGALPEGLIDSELFGAEAGAYTGAQTLRRGRFERASGGTLFLDEVGELSPAAQVRLLRALQDRSIDRVGGSSPIPVDVRIIAATHRPLEAMVAEARFREDLLFRLSVFPIRVPPLRERGVDLPALVRHFVETKSRSLRLGPPPPLAEDALAPLRAYPWPGNVRELEHVVERALILHGGGRLSFESALGGASRRPPSDALDEVVEAHIRLVLERCGGRVEGPGGAAEKLRLRPSTLRSKMKKLGLR